MSLCFRVLPNRLSSLVSNRKPLSKLNRYQLRKNTSSVFLKQFLDTQGIFARATTSKTLVSAVDYISHKNLPFVSFDTCSQWNETSISYRLYCHDDNGRRNLMYWSQMRRLPRMQRLNAVIKNRKHIVPIGITSNDVAVFQMQNVINNVKNNSFLDNNKVVMPVLEDLHSSPELNIKSIILFTNDVIALKTSQQQSSQDNEGKPSQEQLQYVLDCLSQDLPKLFVKPQNYSIYTEDIIFINNIRGVTTKGLLNYVKQLALLKAFGHIKFAYVKFDIIKITMHIEDATVKVRWRIRGISGIRMIRVFWKYKIWDIKEAIERDAEIWYDGFSTYYVNGEGKIYKHIADKVIPDQDVADKKDELRIAPKLALFTGLTDVFNNDECFFKLNTTLKLSRLE